MTSPTSRSDEQLLAHYLDVEVAPGAREAAFHELVGRYRRRVFAVCHQVLDDPRDAEDAAQETFVRLARRGETFRGEAKLSTWLYRVARNVATDLIRHDARRPATPVADIDTAADRPVADHAEASDTAAEVRAALAQLDERSRQLLVLVAVEGLSYAEAAAATDLAVGTVKSRVSRARVQLGALLADGDPGGRPAGPAATDPAGRSAGAAAADAPGGRDPP